MRKSDKKIDNQLRLTLTDVCEEALKAYTGFQWLTHSANYTNFPQSLRVVCVFDTQETLKIFMASKSQHEFSKNIQKALFECGISLKSMTSHIVYDSEEGCNQTHNGNWAVRLKI